MTSDTDFQVRSGVLRVLVRFVRDRDGAVTVDWVALTAFILALGMGATFYVASSVPRVAQNVGSHLENTTVVPD